MFWLEFRKFLRKVNEKTLEAATGKSRSSIYRYAEDPLEQDKNKRGVSMPVDYLIQIITSTHLKREKSVYLLKYLAEACGYELNEEPIKQAEGSIDKQAKQLEVFKSIFSAKNWQALQDNRMTSESAKELIPYAEEEREHLTKYIQSLRKITKEGVKNVLVDK
jgi:mannitol-1-phosphate/altronate dehydrogenase